MGARGGGGARGGKAAGGAGAGERTIAQQLQSATDQLVSQFSSKGNNMMKSLQKMGYNKSVSAYIVSRYGNTSVKKMVANGLKSPSVLNSISPDALLSGIQGQIVEY